MNPIVITVPSPDTIAIRRNKYASDYKLPAVLLDDLIEALLAFRETHAGAPMTEERNEEYLRIVKLRMKERAA